MPVCGGRAARVSGRLEPTGGGAYSDDREIRRAVLNPPQPRATRRRDVAASTWRSIRIARGHFVFFSRCWLPLGLHRYYHEFSQRKLYPTSAGASSLPP